MTTKHKPSGKKRVRVPSMVASVPNSFRVVCGLIIVSLLPLLWVGIVRLAGFKINKEYFSRRNCIENTKQENIEKCTQRSREEHLENTQNWRGQFERYEEYCKNLDENCPERSDIFDFCLDPAFDIHLDPKCSYDKFTEQKGQENREYIASKEKDGFYYSCAEKNCPKQPLLK